jgi:hypothetical protein
MSLLAGLKRHFRFKAAEGLLSKNSLRMLEYACDAALSRPGIPLSIWKEVRCICLAAALVCTGAHESPFTLHHHAGQSPGIASCFCCTSVAGYIIYCGQTIFATKTSLQCADLIVLCCPCLQCGGDIKRWGFLSVVASLHLHLRRYQTTLLRQKGGETIYVRQTCAPRMHMHLVWAYANQGGPERQLQVL